jgi:PAS domain-containing protein
MADDSRGRIFHPEDMDRLRDERRAALGPGVPFESEQRARRKDGQYCWLLIQYKPLIDRYAKKAARNF